MIVANISKVTHSVFISFVVWIVNINFFYAHRFAVFVVLFFFLFPWPTVKSRSGVLVYLFIMRCEGNLTYQ